MTESRKLTTCVKADLLTFTIYKINDVHTSRLYCQSFAKRGYNNSTNMDNDIIYQGAEDLIINNIVDDEMLSFYAQLISSGETADHVFATPDSRASFHV